MPGKLLIQLTLKAHVKNIVELVTCMRYSHEFTTKNLMPDPVYFYDLTHVVEGDYVTYTFIEGWNDGEKLIQLMKDENSQQRWGYIISLCEDTKQRVI
jgi:hypothetical protein